MWRNLQKCEASHDLYGVLLHYYSIKLVINNLYKRYIIETYDR